MSSWLRPLLDIFSCGDRYYHYTGDPHGYLTQYFDRIQGRTQTVSYTHLTLPTIYSV